MVRVAGAARLLQSADRAWTVMAVIVGASFPVGFVLFGWLALPLAGALVGAGQWVVLRNHARIGLSWVLATTVGWVVALPAAAVLMFIGTTVVPVLYSAQAAYGLIPVFACCALAGVIIGGLQGLVIARDVVSVRWLAGQAAAMGCYGTILLSAFAVSLNAAVMNGKSLTISNPITIAPEVAIAGAVGGLAYGIISSAISLPAVWRHA